jgi:Ca2+-binding EF-hand superfamily protein
LDLHDKDLRKFFDHFDADGSGIIDFYEFVEIVLPSDYPISKSKLNGSSKLWDTLPENGERVKMASLKEITKHMYGVPNNKGWSPFCEEVPESIRSFKWTNDYVEGLLRKKINERGAASKDLLQQAYFMFGRPKHGLTLSAFGKVLKEKLGLPVSQEQCAQLFKKYDSSGDGRIDFYEFVEVSPSPPSPIFLCVYISSLRRSDSSPFPRFLLCTRHPFKAQHPCIS